MATSPPPPAAPPPPGEKQRVLTRDDNLRALAKAAKRHPDMADAVAQLARVIESLDFDALAGQESSWGAKYFDLAKHGIRNLECARALGLHHSRPLRVLDLGAGAGYFCWAAQLYGHEARAIEPAVQRTAQVPSLGDPKPHAFAVLQDALGVHSSPQQILAGHPIAGDAVVQGRFELVTGFAIMFNMTRESPVRSCYWLAEDYLYLLADLREHWLAPGGRIAFRFHYQSAGGPPDAYYEALERLLGPFTVGKDPHAGLLLDLDRGTGAWEAARQVMLPTCWRDSREAARRGRFDPD